METVKLSNNVSQQIKVPGTCPLCHRDIVPTKIHENFTLKGIIQVVFRCSSDTCRELFIANYSLIMRKNHADINLIDTKPKSVKPRAFSPEIISLSPDFSEIYNQAKFAEENNLDQVCGAGYRKSIEFLIKDYLIKECGHPETEIKGKFLGQCIDLIEDRRIKLCSERATWLGNDETHYVRRWEDKDLSNLKELIELTLHWISMEHITKRYESDMPK